MARSSTMGAVGRARARDTEDAMDASKDTPVTRKRPCRIDDLHLASDADKKVVREHVHCRDSWMTDH